MLQTKIVEGKKLNGPPEEYVDDGQPDTIELVALPKDYKGVSFVSANGQVVFLTRHDLKKDVDQMPLMNQAIDILEKKEREAATATP